MSLKSFNKIDVNRYELDVEVSPKKFGSEVDKIYNKQKNKINIPGFRKGKAPRAFIEKFYGSQIFYEDAVNAIYPSALDEAVKSANLELVDDHIDFEIVKMSKEEGLIFKVKITVMPEVSVENYKGIHIAKKEIEEVTEKDIESEIESVRHRNSRLITVQDEPAQMGDEVNIDFVGRVESDSTEIDKAEGVNLELGKKQFIEGFEEQLVGHRAGEEFEISVVFPCAYHAENFAGKKALFKVKINRVQKREIPDFDDEFVKDVSEFDTVDAYKDDIKLKLSESKKKQLEEDIQNEILEKFTNLIKVQIPEALIKIEIKNFIKDFEYNLERQGVKLKDYLKKLNMTIEAFEEKFKAQSYARVKLWLGLKQLAKLENITCCEEEINEEYLKLSQRYHMEIDKAKKIFIKDDIAADIETKKAVQFLKENAVIL